MDLPAKQSCPEIWLTCFSVEIMAYRFLLSLTQSCFNQLHSFCVVIATGRNLTTLIKIPDIHLKTSKQESTCSPYYNSWFFHLYQKYSCQKRGIPTLELQQGMLKKFFPFWKGSNLVWVLTMYTQNHVRVIDVKFITGVSVAGWFFQNMLVWGLGFYFNFWCPLSDLLMSGHFSLPDCTIESSNSYWVSA